MPNTLVYTFPVWLTPLIIIGWLYMVIWSIVEYRKGEKVFLVALVLGTLCLVVTFSMGFGAPR